MTRTANFIFNHAEGQIPFLDRAFLPVATKLGEHLKTLNHVVPMGSRDEEAVAIGYKIVLPEPNLDDESLVKLIDREQVTVALGAQTIWMGPLNRRLQKHEGRRTLKKANCARVKGGHLVA